MAYLHFFFLFAGNKRSSIQAERTLPEITAEKYSDSSDIIETKSNVSMEQSDLVDKIEDLTNEVCCLKQLFTTKEVKLLNTLITFCYG
jgi:hypothetical protein